MDPHSSGPLGLIIILESDYQFPLKSEIMKNLRAKNPIFKLLAATAIGTGFCCNNESQLSISISPNFSSALKEFHNFTPIELTHTVNSPSGQIPFTLSRVGDVGDSGKCGSGCLGKDSIANAAAMVAPAVVNITVTHAYYERTLGRSMSSGTIIDSDGTILTCAHAVMDSISSRSVYRGKIDVTLQDGRTYEGTVVNADIHSDIAVVKINSKTPLPTAKLGSSCKLRPGEWVVALGCPLSLQNTVTAGIVSCVDRKSSDMGLGGMRREYLQTDCAINKGNSGGPLVNLDGEIIGVNIMKALAADGVSFSVPIDSVLKVMEHFKKNGRVVRPWLGLKMLDLNELIIAQLKEKDPTFPNITKGVLVPMVTPGSPGDRAGFRPGDVVVEFDGKPAESIKEILERMGDDVGKHFKVVLKRAGDKVVKLTVVPEEGNPHM